MMQTPFPDPTVAPLDMDLEDLFTEQTEAESIYELALTYKSFGFRDKAIIEFYRLNDLRTASAAHFASKLVPLLFH